MFYEKIRDNISNGGVTFLTRDFLEIKKLGIL
jgi:hypothetical protein